MKTSFPSLLSTALLLALIGCGAAPSDERSKRADDQQFMCGGMDARDVLNQIVGQGADLTQEREAIFYFYGREASLPAFQRDMEALGFSVRPARTEPGRIATIRAIFDEEWLGRTMPQVCQAAAKHGISFDGWEASI
jgi:hypothetical protein